MTVSRTFRGYYHSAIAKSESRLLVQIALPRDDGAAFMESLGEKPHRPGTIPIAICAGAAADVLGAILEPAKREPAEIPPAPEPYDFGEAVKLIAHLTHRMSALTDAANGTDNLVQRAIGLEARDNLASELADACDEFNSHLQAAVAGAGGGRA